LTFSFRLAVEWGVGLREKKAQRNRERIVNEALALFRKNGYEQTTMESIAEAAELSESTLYRAFPTKDSIILAPFRSYAERFSEVFARHSAHQPVEEALAEAIFTAVQAEDEYAARTLLVRSIIDQAPTARARLWDYVYAQQKELSRLIAQRLRAKADDLRVVFTAQLAMAIMGLAADRWRDSGGRQASRATAEELMRLLAAGEIVFPRAPRRQRRTKQAAARE
jgi:AcrR family transcriptional regulator